MKRLPSAIWLFAIQMILSGVVWAGPVISLVPQRETTQPLENFYVDVVVSGMQSGANNTLLGGFDLTLNYDAQLVQFLQIGSFLGAALGDPSDPLQTVIGADVSVPPGSFHFYEVSLLEGRAASCFFCIGPYLEDLQSDSFVLSHMLFYATGPTGPATGAAAFSISSAALSDADGNAIDNFSLVNADVKVIPEPSGLLLTVSALLIAMLAGPKGLRQRTTRGRTGSLTDVLISHPTERSTATATIGARIALALSLGAAVPVHAATFSVPAGDTVALVQAIGIANGLAGSSVINLSASTYFITSASDSSSSYGNNGLPTITGDIVINGNGATIARSDSAETMRAVQVSGTGRLTLNRTTISNFDQGGTSATIGNLNLSGAIYSQGQLSLNNSNIQDNLGRGLVNLNSGRVTLVNTVFQRNLKGGAIRNESGTISISGGRISANAGGDGAGISNGATLTIDSATIDNNDGRDGSGLANAGFATIVNSTVSGNRASGDGGGIWNLRSLVLINVTVANNSAGRFGGGIWNYHATGSVPAALQLINTLVAGNIGSVTVGLNSRDDCTDNDRNTSGTNSLIQDGQCDAVANGFLVGDPSIGLLDNNGGATWTHALLQGSVAIDAGSTATCPASDQRGVARPQDGNGDGMASCDIGAFEVLRSSADFSGNGCVDNADMALMLAIIGSPGIKNPKFDLNGDGKVTIADARKLATMFSKPGGQSCD